MHRAKVDKWLFRYGSLHESTVQSPILFTDLNFVHIFCFQQGREGRFLRNCRRLKLDKGQFVSWHCWIVCVCVCVCVCGWVGVANLQQQQNRVRVQNWHLTNNSASRTWNKERTEWMHLSSWLCFVTGSLGGPTVQCILSLQSWTALPAVPTTTPGTFSTTTALYPLFSVTQGAAFRKFRILGYAVGVLKVALLIKQRIKIYHVRQRTVSTMSLIFPIYWQNSAK